MLKTKERRKLLELSAVEQEEKRNRKEKMPRRGETLFPAQENVGLIQPGSVCLIGKAIHPALRVKKIFLQNPIMVTSDFQISRRVWVKALRVSEEWVWCLYYEIFCAMWSPQIPFLNECKWMGLRRNGLTHVIKAAWTILVIKLQYTF